ncbi:MAG: response regulator [Alphaproteobacteria bacterium]|nr:response regulator [Alphaproteobacteria bacterium]
MAYKLENARVLVVDDMPPMLSLTKSLLNIAGFKNVLTAGSGETAFDLFCRESPDLVITDWIMEPMDGLELVERIRTDTMSPDRYVPVIVMSGFSSRFRVETARDRGVTEFLVKPFMAKDLYAKIEHVIEHPRQFVEAEQFFGPDRRRRRRGDYEGPRRREDDGAYGTGNSATDKRAADTLRKLVEETRKRTQ